MFSLPQKLEGNYEKLVLILAAYGIVQVLAQDLGIKSGKKQRDLIQKLPVQIALFFAGAYVVTNDTNLTVITVGIYYGLKYVYSEGKLSNVCFEEV
jgi:hypothetical protein